MIPFIIRPLVETDRAWVRRLIAEHWGDEIMVVHGQVFRPHEHPGLAAFDGDQCIGLVTYRIAGAQCEVLSLDSLRERCGIGSTLLAAVAERARAAGCVRLYLTTTNDNMNALRFYQKRGLMLAALHRNAVDQARTIKPAIPLIGYDGIPLRDELELEQPL